MTRGVSLQSSYKRSRQGAARPLFSFARTEPYRGRELDEKRRFRVDSLTERPLEDSVGVRLESTWRPYRWEARARVKNERSPNCERWQPSAIDSKSIRSKLRWPKYAVVLRYRETTREDYIMLDSARKVCPAWSENSRELGPRRPILAKRRRMPLTRPQRHDAIR